jgi:hypothetical protein
MSEGGGHMNTVKYWIKRIALAVPAVVLLGLSMAPKRWNPHT